MGRLAAARSFGKQVLALDAREGVVVGVLGPWGSGKTSFVNLARPEFEQAGVPVLEFNPWMFSGASQLVESFFIELAAQLKLRPNLATLGQDLADYGDMFSGMGWLPFVGSWIERVRGAMKIIGTISQHRKEGIGARRARIEKGLASLDKAVIIFLDDIDRLSTSEIRDIFKLVRLTASFPNLIYIVAFDRQRVEVALADQGIPGRDYLEKILQIAIDLPAVPDVVLNQQIGASLDAALATTETRGPFDENAWPDLFAEIVQPLVRNMRDVRRYAVAVKGTVAAVGGEIALADLLALEAIRVFLPDVFAGMHGAVDALTSTARLGYGTDRETPRAKQQLDELIKAGGKQAEVVRATIARLFPAAQRHIGGSHYGDEWKTPWLRARRVAHEDILRLYLERVAGEGLRSFVDAEQAWAYFADRTALDNYLRSIEKSRLQSVIASLESYEDQFKLEHVVPATVVLLNLLHDIPERHRTMYDLPSRFTVTRVALRLLRSLKDPGLVEAAVREILPELKSLSSKLELIRLVGYQMNAGHKLVSEEAASEFEKSWRSEVRASSLTQLLQEQDLLAVLVCSKRDAEASERDLVIDKSPEMARALLRCARTEVMSQSLDSRAVRRFPTLNWESLTALYGDETKLKEAIERLRATNPQEIGDLLEVADKYLSGWRPNRHDLA